MPIWKKLLILPPIALGIVLLVVFIKGRSGPEKVAPEELTHAVRSVTLAPRDVTPTAIAYGTVHPSKTWVATAEISGRVAFISPLLKKGEVVPADHELIRIDNADQKLEVARLTAEANALSAQIDTLNLTETNAGKLLALERRSLELANTELTRLEQLAKEGPVSVAEVDAQRRRVLTQEGLVLNHQNSLRLVPSERARLTAQLTATQARVKRAEHDVQRAVLKSPFACRIETVNIELTQAVAPGQVLAAAFDVGVAEVEARIAVEQARHLFRPLDREQIAEGLRGGVDWTRFGIEATVRLRLPSNTYTWPGTFARAAASLSATTRSAGMVIAVDKPFQATTERGHPPLVKGMFVEVELRGPVRSNCLVVPRAAIHAGRLYTIGKDSRLVLRPVTVDFAQGDDAILKSGVDAGTRVVTTDLVPAVEGMLLTPHETVGAR